MRCCLRGTPGMRPACTTTMLCDGMESVKGIAFRYASSSGLRSPRKAHFGCAITSPCYGICVYGVCFQKVTVQYRHLATQSPLETRDLVLDMLSNSLVAHDPRNFRHSGSRVYGHRLDHASRSAPPSRDRRNAVSAISSQLPRVVRKPSRRASDSTYI